MLHVRVGVAKASRVLSKRTCVKYTQSIQCYTLISNVSCVAGDHPGRKLAGDHPQNWRATNPNLVRKAQWEYWHRGEDLWLRTGDIFKGQAAF